MNDRRASPTSKLLNRRASLGNHSGSQQISQSTTTSLINVWRPRSTSVSGKKSTGSFPTLTPQKKFERSDRLSPPRVTQSLTLRPETNPPAVLSKKRPFEVKEPPVPKSRAKKDDSCRISIEIGPLLAIPTTSILIKASQKVDLEPLTPVGNPVQLSPHFTPGVCGLTNLGNTCFMNSALQCLSHIPDLTRQAQEQYPLLSKDSNDILYAYASLIQTMWSGEKKVADPSDIKRLVGRAFPIFADYGQKDAHEFMNCLFNLLEKTSWAPFIDDLIHIRTKSVVTCARCPDPDSIDEVINFLPLALPRETSRHREISLVELIEEFTMEESLDGSYFCQKCNTLVSAKQRTIISFPLPNALIIQLKRFPFDGTNTKISTFVRYKLNYENLLAENDAYHLCAVSVHVGTLAHGHYTTFGKNANTQQWYRFNDTQCDEVAASDVITKDAYILVYLRSDRLK